jgi:two-component system heavy metal sensor histidine kinase CusS
MRLSGQKSITFRLTLLFASASTAVLLLLGFLIGRSVEQHFEEQDMEVLSGKLELARHALEKVHSKRDLDSISQQLDDSLIGHHALEVLVVGPDGKTLFATREADFPQALLDRQILGIPARPTVWKSKQGKPFRGLAARTQTGISGIPPAVVAVATDISHHEHFMSSFRITLWSVVILAALLTGVLGWAAVRRGLAPLQAIKREAAGITANRLSARLPTDSIPTELADLTETLNQMLARLENSFQRLSDFSSDLAHELRTPVSNLLTQTQVTLSKARTGEEYHDVLASNVEEFERLSRMIADMLFLAKSENDLIVPNREPVDLAVEAEGLLEYYGVLADEKHIELGCLGSGVVWGDRLMIRRAISNLISNAVRHTPHGGRVAVRIDDSDRKVAKLVVENTGDTIPAEHMERLFDRFYRVDTSRQYLGEGAGLGLAITRSIARAHGGEILGRSSHGITAFELTVPFGPPKSAEQANGMK